jgi:hypothetical protein
MKSIEFESLLNYLVFEMEKQGFVTTNYHFSLDEEFVDLCNGFCNSNSNLNEYTNILNQCITQEYIARTTFDLWSNLAITRKGMGVVLSNRRVKEIRESRTRFNKISDFVEEHKAVSIIIGTIISIFTLIGIFWKGCQWMISQ